MKLYFPRDIKIRTEFMKGFGWKELGEAGVICAILLAGDIIYYLLTWQQVTAFIVGFIIVIGSFMFTVKDISNQSVLDLIKNIIYFSKTQKTYYYKYMKEWGD